MLWHQAIITTFPSSKGPGLSAIMNLVYSLATYSLYGPTLRTSHPTHRGNSDKGKRLSLPAQLLAALVTHSHVTVSHSWGLINCLWPETAYPETMLNHLPHDVGPSSVSGGFPKNYPSGAPLPFSPISGLDWCLPPLPAHPSIQLFSLTCPRPFYKGLPSKIQAKLATLNFSELVDLPTWLSSHRTQPFLKCVPPSFYPGWDRPASTVRGM